MEREHLFATDPEATALLSEAVRRLSLAFGRPDETGAFQHADELTKRLVTDGNPRVRAQVRALEHVLRLLESGERDEAEDLLKGDLTRSFPGEGDLSEAEIFLSEPGTGNIPE
jgi:hypothetical protein